MDAILNWALRAAFMAIGVGAALGLLAWVRDAWREQHERWPVLVGLAMLLLAGVYAVGHARLLASADTLESGRLRYTRYGDPRMAELRRAEVRGWIRDCSGEPENSFALYRERGGEILRTYPAGEAGANLVGGGKDAEQRDYTVERLYAEQLRAPRSFGEWGEPHPAGDDLRLTLCSGATERAYELLQATRNSGAVVVQDVQTGGLVAYAATGGPEQAPYGIQRYAPPGSVFKLALAALWWESDLPPEQVIPCPASIKVTPRATISNAGNRAYGTVAGPAGMLVPSCNTAAVWMAQQLRERMGSEAFADAYRQFGFTPYPKGEPPSGRETDFWATTSDRWTRRMSPPPARIRLGEATGKAEWAQLSIGQGPIDVTPIHISRFVQAIGNGGIMLPPTLEWELAESSPKGTRVMSKNTAERLQQAMRAVVDRGTARSVLPVLEGSRWDLGGKTGTAQVRNAPDDGWFAGLIFDAQGRPRYTVVAYLRGGGPGGRKPAAIAAQMTRYLARQQPAAGPE